MSSLGSAGYQAVEDLKTIIKQNWNKTAKAGEMPLLVSEWQEKTLNYQNKDYILVKYDVEIINAFGLHADDWRHDVPITLDLRTAKSDKRLVVILNEVIRILKTNVRTAGYMIMLPKSTKNMFEEYRNIWRNIVDLELTKINP